MTDHASLDNQVRTDPLRRDKNRSWAITLCSNSTIAANTQSPRGIQNKGQGFINKKQLQGNSNVQYSKFRPLLPWCMIHVRQR